MAGGGMGATGVAQTGEGQAGQSSPFAGAGTPPSTMADNFGGAPQRAQPSLYSTLTQPVTRTINDAYGGSLGRAPEQAGFDYWANIAQQEGWTGQQLGENIISAGEPERARTGFSNQLNPSWLTSARVGTTPSSFNTNPYQVDYANIFNPAPVFDEQAYLQQKLSRVQAAPGNEQYSNYTPDRLRGLMASQGMTPQQHYEMFGRTEGLNPFATGRLQGRQVVSAQPALTSQEQAQYLTDWQRDYSQRNRTGTETAKRQRAATANQQWEKYFGDRAKADQSQAVREAVAAKEREMQEQYAANQPSYDNAGGQMYFAAGGGSVPSGLRSIRRK